MIHEEEPIVALASGAGGSAIAILRLAGGGCLELLERCLTSSAGGVAAWPDRRLTLCKLLDPSDGSVIDEPMAVVFRTPHSYTGQDAAELYLHGGPYIVQRAMRLLLSLGCRPAEPGEFTRRAFLNGKLDLTAAEGIAELIAASSHQQWLAARQLASGKLRKEIEELRSLLLEAMAWLEARIDFPDEQETASVEMAEVKSRVDRVQRAAERLSASYNSGKVASRGLGVALVGRPNAGKSTLLNSLLGSERAIVTEIAGTTRDYLEESCLVEGRLVRLIDTAGIRDSGFDKIEKIGIERSLKIAREADVVVFLAPADGEVGVCQEVSSWLAELKPPAHIKVVSKTDLGTPEWASEDDGWIAVSCQSGQGLDELRRSLVTRVDEHVGCLLEEGFISSARHQAALEKALAALARFYQSLHEGAYEEMLAFELQEAAKALASIVGHVDSDEVLGVIFSTFCVGK